MPFCECRSRDYGDNSKEYTLIQWLKWVRRRKTSGWEGKGAKSCEEVRECPYSVLAAANGRQNVPIHGSASADRGFTVLKEAKPKRERNDRSESETSR